MVQVIPFETLGRHNHGWLDARYHFSFARYFNPERMGYPPLRVWNDDTIKEGTGFPMHPHQNMEIITYVRSGAITHEDSLGNKGRTTAGNVQVMSAGQGIVHSEFNLENEETSLFQIWIETASPGVDPSWATHAFPSQNTDMFSLLASGRSVHRSNNVLPINQDIALLAVKADHGTELIHELETGRHVYLVPSEGKITVNGKSVNTRDGVAVSETNALEIKMEIDGEIILVDLPAV